MKEPFDITTPPENAHLLSRFKEMFGCDQVRISAPFGMLFLILGWKENTKRDRQKNPDTGQWVDGEGNPIDFDYVREETVASGKNEEELIASAERYKRVIGMTMEEYLGEEMKQ